MAPAALAAPFINLFCIILLGIILGWWYALGLLIAALLALIVIHFLNKVLKSVKMRESLLNDNRLKLINDMVLGIRTIKCYAWGLLYLDKVKALRKK